MLLGTDGEKRVGEGTPALPPGKGCRACPAAPTGAVFLGSAQGDHEQLWRNGDGTGDLLIATEWPEQHPSSVLPPKTQMGVFKLQPTGSSGWKRVSLSGLFPKKLPWLSYKLSSNPFVPNLRLFFFFFKSCVLRRFLHPFGADSLSSLLFCGLWGEIKCKCNKIQLIFYVPGTVEFRGLK